MISSEHIRMMLKNNWSKLKFIWLTDSQYILMNFNELITIVKACSVKHFSAKGEVWDCDNYALQLHARVQAYQYDLIKSGMKSMSNSWAFGECIGFDNDVFSSGVHAINIAITDKGIIFIEPQEDRVWLVDKDEMSLFFVKF